LTRANRLNDFFETYTKDLKAGDLQRLFTRDAREAYQFFARHIDFSDSAALPRHKRLLRNARLLFLAFTMKLSPARRLVYGIALVLAFIGFFDLLRLRVEEAGRVGHVIFVLPGMTVPNGMGALLLAFALVNLLVLLEVADRLSLKNDLEIAREIQQAMLPGGGYAAPGVETFGFSRPANTVGGDFYDVLPRDDGRLVIAVGDVAGKGSPASLLMALLLAMMRTLVDENLEPAELVSRLNVQICRHAPGSRFITLFYGVYQPATGELIYVNAGHMPPLIIRTGGETDRLTDGGIALGMFDASKYAAGRAVLQKDELLAIYSDGITEAESAAGRPFDEQGLENALKSNRARPLAAIGGAVVAAVERHTGDTKFADDLTILLVRASTPAPAGV
jgi:serine phosphatase RsbU (regulator of sigma subunit)